MNSRNNAARVERQRQKLDAEPMGSLFPGVSGIVVSMTNNQKGLLTSFTRVIRFFPESHSLFRISCLNKECVGGGYDLSQVIAGMVRLRKKAARGDIRCEGNCLPDNNSTIAYEIAIQYAQNRP